MRAFNAFQITFLFAAFPFLVSYLANATFPYAAAAFWVSAAAYVVAFFFMTVQVYDQLARDARRA